MAALRSRGGHDYTVWETDPTGQYSRYSKRIDEGDLKEVYLGYDETNGREVAWCKKFLKTDNLDTLITEAELLKSFNHQNVIKCFYYFWVEKNIELDTKVELEFNMITELYSGNLRDYTQKHQVKENSPAIKKWCRQILTGLDYLHSQSQPIIHNDLKCENIFVAGKSGTIKLGDLSAAKTLVLTSPENDDVGMIARSEVHCLGLCVLQMLRDERLRTMDFSLLNSIQDRQLRNFIQKCVYPADIRPTIAQLLNDPFLLPRTAPSGYTQEPPIPATSPPRAQPVLQPRSATDLVTEHRRFTLQGERIDRELMAVTLRTTQVKNTNFVFSLRTDTVSSMMDVITAEVNTNADVELMAHTLERLRFYIANIGLGGPRLDDEPQEDNISEPLEIKVRIQEQVREADGNDINNSDAAAANSEGDIDDSNIALSFEQARLMAASIPRF